MKWEEEETWNEKQKSTRILLRLLLPVRCNSKMVKKNLFLRDDLAPFSGLVSLYLTPPNKLA